MMQIGNSTYNERFNEYYTEYMAALNSTFNESEGNNMGILHPDNPLMMRFQAALKSLLEKQLGQLNDVVLELECSIKSLKNEKYSVSDATYNEQEEIHKQEILLCQYRQSITNFITMREDTDNQLMQLKNKYQEECSETDRLEKENMQLQERLEFTNIVTHRLVESNDKQESGLVISKRIMEKNIHDKKKVLHDKQMQDIIMMKLEKDVMKLEKQEGRLKSKLIVDAVDLDDLAKIADSKCADIDTIAEENSTLFASWRNVVNAVKNRDESYTETANELINLENRRKELECELDSFERKNEESMIESETLTIEKDKMEEYLNSLTRENIQMLKHKETLENTLDNIIIITESNQKILEQILLEKTSHTSDLTVAKNVIKKINLKNIQLEELVLLKLQEQIISNNGALTVNINIKYAISKIREHEDLLANCSEVYLLTSLEIQNQDNELKNCMHHLSMIKTEEKSKRDETDQIRIELSHVKTLAEKNSILLAKRNIYLENLCKKVPTFDELNETIKLAYKDVKEITHRNEELKRKWIRKQNEVILLMEQKSNGIRELELMKKRMFVLEYKKTNLDFCIAQFEKEGSYLNRQMSSLLNSISKLNCSYSNRKEFKGVLNNENVTTYNHHLCDLKDAEDEMLTLVKEIQDIEADNADLYKKLLNLQSEDISWEEKIKMAADMRQEILKEKSTNGEIGNMKIEIHHMEIRYSQLKRAQDKLSSDLEMCVLKRDSIVENVMSGQKKPRNRFFREILSRKLDYVRNKIIQTNLEMKRLDDKYFITDEDISCLKLELKNGADQMEFLQQSLRKLNEEIRDMYSEKYNNLELCIYKQRKLGYMLQAKNGSYITLYRSNGALEAEYLKQSCLNSDLTSIMEALKDDFPLYDEDASKILYFLHIALL